MRVLGYAVMGVLARGESSGYDLKRKMESPVGYFWRAGHSQIYPELARLEGEGMVSHRLVEQIGKPDKKVYAITPEGRKALEDWLVEPVEVAPIRDELVLKAYSVWLADPQKAARVFRRGREDHEERLRNYLGIKEWMEKEWAGDLGRTDTPAFGAHAALMRGISFEKEYAGWCRWMCETLEQSAMKEEK